MRREMFCPTSSCAWYPSKFSRAVLALSIRPRLSMTTMPSIALSKIERILVSLSRQANSARV